MIYLIVAVDRGNAIGWSDGRLAWHIPEDLKYFKALTTGHTVIMGFNTWKSLNRPMGLPNRKNIILTSKPYSEARAHFDPNAEVDIVSDFTYIEQLTSRHPDQLFWIIGGASVYAEALRRGIIDRIYVTQIDGMSGADVRLPIDLYSWKRFIVTERTKGVFWEPIAMESIPGNENIPPTARLVLEKNSENA